MRISGFSPDLGRIAIWGSENSIYFVGDLTLTSFLSFLKFLLCITQENFLWRFIIYLKWYQNETQVSCQIKWFNFILHIFSLFFYPWPFLPQNFLLSQHASEVATQFAEKSKQSLIEEFFNAGNRIPEIEGPLWLKQEGKKSWKKHYFVLRGSGLYYSPKGKSKVRNPVKDSGDPTYTSGGCFTKILQWILTLSWT